MPVLSPDSNFQYPPRLVRHPQLPAKMLLHLHPSLSARLAIAVHLPCTLTPNPRHPNLCTLSPSFFRRPPGFPVQDGNFASETSSDPKRHGSRSNIVPGAMSQPKSSSSIKSACTGLNACAQPCGPKSRPSVKRSAAAAGWPHAADHRAPSASPQRCTPHVDQ